ncbi:MAG: SRPBCC domain-containing protein [Planctomycetota bacterium]
MKQNGNPLSFYLWIAILLFSTCLSAWGTDETGKDKVDTQKPMHQYVVKLIGTRPGWPDQMTADEMKVMHDHYYYLKDLVAEKKVILAGPCPEGRYGLIIIQVASEQEAVDLMDREPSVKGGVHTYEMEPIHVALLVDHQSPERYVIDPDDRVLRKEATVKATLDEAWNAWTTTEGVTTFFAPEARVALSPGGPYEIFFSPTSPAGSRGSEGCKVLTWLTRDTLCFDWNAPPSFGELRKKHTRVTVRLEALEDGRVKVMLCQEGWGRGEDWDKLYNYFDRAWAFVLSNLKGRFDNGPLDWTEGE